MSIKACEQYAWEVYATCERFDGTNAEECYSKLQSMNKDHMLHFLNLRNVHKILINYIYILMGQKRLFRHDNVISYVVSHSDLQSKLKWIDTFMD